jgi:thiol:disulfide interchange protein DsbD
MKKILIILTFITSIYAKDSNLTIFNNYKEAIEVAKEQKKPIFILFSKDGCRWCKKLKENIETVDELKNRLKEEFIVLLLDKNRDKYPSKYKIEAVPTIFLTSETEDIYTQIIGYHKNIKDYTKWFNYVKIERED